MADIASWLGTIGLGRHIAAFVENGVDVDVLRGHGEGPFGSGDVG